MWPLVVICSLILVRIIFHNYDNRKRNRKNSGKKTEKNSLRSYI